jgi:hypothetical protein
MTPQIYKSDDVQISKGKSIINPPFGWYQYTTSNRNYNFGNIFTKDAFGAAQLVSSRSTSYPKGIRNGDSSPIERRNEM